VATRGSLLIKLRNGKKVDSITFGAPVIGAITGEAAQRPVRPCRHSTASANTDFNPYSSQRIETRFGRLVSEDHWTTAKRSVQSLPSSWAYCACWAALPCGSGSPGPPMMVSWVASSAVLTVQ
jgi:hypothetical protein